jgi:hypothetical protein
MPLPYPHRPILPIFAPNTTAMAKRKLTAEERNQLLKTLKARFEKNNARHKSIDWADVEARLKEHTDKLWSLL